jgi:hypothetical protein
VSYIAKGLLPYRGLGSGIKRALEDWPDIDFADDRDANLFTATVHRKELIGSVESETSSEKILALLKAILNSAPGKLRMRWESLPGLWKSKSPNCGMKTAYAALAPPRAVAGRSSNDQG